MQLSIKHCCNPLNPLRKNLEMKHSVCRPCQVTGGNRNLPAWLPYVLVLFVCVYKYILSTHMYIYAYNQCLFPHLVCSQIPSFSVFQKYFMSYPPNAHRRFQWHKQRPSEYKYLKSKKIIHSQISSYFGSINSFPAAPGTKKLCLFSICNLDWIIY